MKECLNYKFLEKGIVQCEACHHFCKIRENHTGICGIRQNIDKKLYLLTYGKTVAANFDPVEKKPLFHFLPGTKILSFGTLGCNFHCANCQNFDISQMYERKGQVSKYGEIDWGRDLSPAEAVRRAKQANCESIAFTYNEPTVFLEYALDTMKLARKEGLKNVWVSNGFMSNKTLDLIIPYLDAINIDIKSLADKFYQTNCGARVQPVLDNCKRLVKEGVWTEITTLVIPTLSDDEVMLKQLAEFIKKELGDFVPWHVSAFSGAISWKLQNLPDTSADKIKKVYAIGKALGLKYVYAGNIWEEDFESTYCSQCGEKVICRVGYEISKQGKNGQCQKCGKKIEGIF